MKFLRFLIHLMINIKKGTSFTQFLLFFILILVLLLVGLIAFLKVIIPFTYVAL